MDRRAFLAGMVTMMAARGADAKQAGKVYRIGMLERDPQRRRDREAEDLRGLEVDEHFALCRMRGGKVRQLQAVCWIR